MFFIKEKEEAFVRLSTTTKSIALERSSCLANLETLGFPLRSLVNVGPASSSLTQVESMTERQVPI